MAEYIDKELVLRQLDEKYISAIVQQKHDDVTEEHKKLWKGIQSGVNYARNIVSEAPTKDVVPRSEVEQLQRNLEQCENGYRQQIHLLTCKHKDEVEKIFEEIEKTIMNTNWTSQNYKEWYFGELKKKYIGEGNERSKG